MLNLTKFKFEVLDIFGKNYLSCILNADIQFDAMGFYSTIRSGNNASTQEYARQINANVSNIMEPDDGSPSNLNEL